MILLRECRRREDVQRRIAQAPIYPHQGLSGRGKQALRGAPRRVALAYNGDRHWRLAHSHIVCVTTSMTAIGVDNACRRTNAPKRVAIEEEICKLIARVYGYRTAPIWVP